MSADPPIEAKREPSERAQLVVRVAPATVFIFGALFSPLVACALVFAWRTGATRDGVLLSALYLIAVQWMCGRQVGLEEDTIVYRAWLARQRIAIRSIASLSLDFEPSPKLVFRDANDGALGAFLAKPFSNAGLAAIVKHVQQGQNSVRVDPSLIRRAEGDGAALERDNRVTQRRVAIVSALAVVAMLAVAALRFASQ